MQRLMLGNRETTAAARFLCRSLGRVVGCVDGLTDEEAHWRPPSPTANSLLAIAWHTLGNAEDNVLGVLGGADVDRERTAEFDDSQLTAQAIRQRWGQLEGELVLALTSLPPAALVGEVRHPRRGQLTGFEVLVVALRHAAEHMARPSLPATSSSLAVRRRNVPDGEFGSIAGDGLQVADAHRRGEPEASSWCLGGQD